MNFLWNLAASDTQDKYIRILLHQKFIIHNFWQVLSKFTRQQIVSTDFQLDTISVSSNQWAGAAGAFKKTIYTKLQIADAQ